MTEKTRLDFTGPEIDDTLEGIESHVSFAIEQETDVTEKAQARSNIGAQGVVDAVETVEQDRTNTERARARANIGAVASDAINEMTQNGRELDNTLNNKIDFTQAQELSAEQHRQAQENLGLHIQEKTSKMILPVGRDNNGKFWTYDIAKSPDLDTWEGVGEYIARGFTFIFAPGSELGAKKIIGSTTEYLKFDVLGVDYDTPIDSNVKHTVTLALHDVYINNEIPFDSPEAIFYFSNGLPAGTYTYKYNGTDYSFTLATGWSPNTQVKGPTGKLTPYIKGAFDTSGEETPTAAKGTGGTFLGMAGRNIGSSTTLTIDGVNYPVEINAGNNVSFGSNRWETSSVRQYLNSNAAGAAPGQIASWWTPQTVFDRPIKSTKPGFLYGFEQGFLDLLVDVKKRTYLPPDSRIYKDSDEKVFLLSLSELSSIFANNGDENSFGTDRTFTNVLDTPYPLYAGDEDADRIKYLNGKACDWYLRSMDYTFLDDGGAVSFITNYGGISACVASACYGVVPVLCIGR